MGPVLGADLDSETSYGDDQREKEMKEMKDGGTPDLFMKRERKKREGEIIVEMVDMTVMLAWLARSRVHRYIHRWCKMTLKGKRHERGV